MLLLQRAIQNTLLHVLRRRGDCSCGWSLAVGLCTVLSLRLVSVPREYLCCPSDEPLQVFTGICRITMPSCSDVRRSLHFHVTLPNSQEVVSIYRDHSLLQNTMIVTFRRMNSPCCVNTLMMRAWKLFDALNHMHGIVLLQRSKDSLVRPGTHCLESVPSLTDAAKLKANLAIFSGGVPAKTSKRVPVAISIATNLHRTSSCPLQSPSHLTRTRGVGAPECSSTLHMSGHARR